MIADAIDKREKRIDSLKVNNKYNMNAQKKAEKPASTVTALRLVVNSCCSHLIYAKNSNTFFFKIC